MRRVRHVIVLAVAVGTGVFLSACGGDSSPETPIVVPTETQQAQGKEEFISQADSACAEANTQIEQFASSGQGLTEADQIANLRKGVVDQLKSLDPPAEDKTTLDQFLQAMSDQVDSGQKISLAQKRGEDTTQFESELDSAKTQAEQAASSYGFKECGQPVSSSSTSTSSSSSSSSGGTVTPSAPSTGSGTSSGGTSGSGTSGSGTSGSSGSSGSSGGSSGGIGPG